MTPYTVMMTDKSACWRKVLGICVVVAIVLTPNMSAPSVHAGEAGVDGDHIYAGIAYDSDGSLDRCEWVLPETTYRLGVRAGLTTRTWNGITWTLYDCERDGTSRLVWLPDISTETAAASTREVMRERVPMFDHNFSPPAHRGVVKTPTWFWVQPVLWRPVSVTARVPTPRGIITMTTTATPESLEFHPGDDSGEIAECDGPGLPWSSLLPRFVESECVYEYPIPSSVRSGGVFRARLDVVWSVAWRTNLGASGRLPDLRLGTPYGLRVRELQAVVTR